MQRKLQPTSASERRESGTLVCLDRRLAERKSFPVFAFPPFVSLDTRHRKVGAQQTWRQPANRVCIHTHTRICCRPPHSSLRPMTAWLTQSIHASSLSSCSAPPRREPPSRSRARCFVAGRGCRLWWASLRPSAVAAVAVLPPCYLLLCYSVPPRRRLRARGPSTLSFRRQRTSTSRSARAE